MEYLHCLKDEKFLDGAISLFEEDKSVNNTYILFVNNPLDYTFKYIKSPLAKKNSIDLFLEIVNQYETVVLHSLTSIPIDFIPQIPKRIKVVWLMWGFDFYNSRVYPQKLLHRLTYNCLSLHDQLKIRLSSFVFHITDEHKYQQALYRVDFFSGVFPYEYSLLLSSSRYPGIKAKQVDFYYGSTDFFIPEEPSRIINNLHSNIIVGNSADPTNNALDAFELMYSKLDINVIEKVIVPLSYGNNERYIAEVKETGKRLWGNRFEPLESYIPLDDYLSLISNCRVAVFFHERQQASDNVLMQLLFGARVYMSETSEMFQYLKREGYHIYSLQRDLEMINTLLSDEEVIENRALLSKNYSTSKLVERVIRMNSIIADC